MSEQSQGRQTGNKKRTANKNRAYIHGNAVRKLDIPENVELLPKKKLSHAARKNRDKAVYMNMGYVLFLSAALAAAGFILIGYIRLQCDITSSVKTISKLESQLNTMKLDNDEEYNRVLASVDLEEIKKTAINELGMKYADKGQIVIVSGDESDYVRQYADLPQSKK